MKIIIQLVWIIIILLGVICSHLFDNRTIIYIIGFIIGGLSTTVLSCSRIFDDD